MRMTLTLEDDVAARLKRMRKNRPFKELVNEALRLGLEALERRRTRKPRRYSLVAVKGYPRRTDLDNVAEVIAEAEGPEFLAARIRASRDRR